MASASTQSSSSSGSIGSGQSSAMASIPSYSMLNHTFPVKLDRTNYILWRSQIDNVVFANGFEDYIDGTSKARSNHPQLDLLISHTRYYGPNHRSYLFSLCLDCFGTQFSSSSRARIMQLRLELQSTKKGSMAMIDYIMKIKGAADNLAAIGEPVLEQDQVMNLLGGLGSDYNAVVTAINIRDDKISLEAIHSMLLAFEHRLEQQSSLEQLSTMSANYASSSNNRGGGRKFNGTRG
ncbi:hypothetical protein UlMin_026650 [Ulmus minor]